MKTRRITIEPSGDTDRPWTFLYLEGFRVVASFNHKTPEIDECQKAWLENGTSPIIEPSLQYMPDVFRKEWYTPEEVAALYPEPKQPEI